jgi:hypothetical protein
MPEINTKQVTDRRELHFDTLQQILDDAQTVTAGGDPDAVRCLGNWSAAQNIHHVAQTIRMSREGFGDVTVPLPMKLIGNVLRITGRTAKPFPAGIKPPPKVAASFAPPDDIDLPAALQLLADQVRLATPGSLTAKSPLFGRLSDAQWRELHCRHGELHLSFLISADGPNV